MAADSFSRILDDLVAADADLAKAAARRSAVVEEARRASESEASATRPHTRSAAGWNDRVVARRTLISEIACALRLGERAAERLVEESRALHSDLPQTIAALESGAISYRHAQMVIDNARFVPADAVAEFERVAMPMAAGLTAAQLDRRLRILRERLHPDSIDERHAEVRDSREVRLEPGRDGMAWLSAYLPAAEAHGIFQRLTDIAREIQGPTDCRTLTQLRVDAFIDLLVSGETGPTPAETVRRIDRGIGTGVAARVLVTVPVLTMLGRGDEPAQLEGYGPIDTATALELAGGATSFTRILTHPETGTVLSVGRNSYSVPSDLRTWLRVRDGTCRFPGCARAAPNCDIDHGLDWLFQGETAYDNLAHLCPSHHHLKHHTRWSIVHGRDGEVQWTSPSGRRYTTEPQTVLGAIA